MVRRGRKPVIRIRKKCGAGMHRAGVQAHEWVENEPGGGQPEDGAMKRWMNEPTVCAMMLTADRPELAKRAVECFRAQTYPSQAFA